MKKYKISQLAAKPIRHELVHPVSEINTTETGGTGIFIELVGPQSTRFTEAKEKFDKSEKVLDDNIRLLASTICNWDTEDFEVPYSEEYCFELLKKPENLWIINDIQRVVRDHLNFFQIG